jgi:hypothetical protein
LKSISGRKEAAPHPGRDLQLAARHGVTLFLRDILLSKYLCLSSVPFTFNWASMRGIDSDSEETHETDVCKACEDTMASLPPIVKRVQHAASTCHR